MPHDSVEHDVMARFRNSVAMTNHSNYGNCSLLRTLLFLFHCKNIAFYMNNTNVNGSLQISEFPKDEVLVYSEHSDVGVLRGIAGY